MEAIDPACGRGHWVVTPEEAAAAYVGGFSLATRQSYGSVLRKWLWFCRDTHLDPWAVSRIHIEAYLRTMAPHSSKAAATVICGFYRDAHGNGLTSTDLAVGVRRPRVGRRKPGTWATPEELRRMLDHAETMAPDESALLHILILTGARLGEVLALNVADVDPGPPARVTLHRKNSHVDVLTMPARVTAALHHLLLHRTTGPLLRHDGKRLTSNRARSVVVAVAEHVGCAQHITPHSLRRSFVTLARDLGVSDTDIMAMTGHTDAAMVDYYDRGRRQRDGAAGAAVDAALQKEKPHRP